MDKTFDELATWKDHAVKMREIVCRHIESIHLNDEEVKWMDEIRAAMDARRIRAAVLSEYGAREPVAWRWDEATYTENDVRGRCWQYNIFGTQKPNTPWMQRNVTPLYAAPASPLLPGLERASLTHNPTHGAALWLGKRLVARIAGGAEVSAVTESDPIPQWRKDAETFVNAVNSASSPLLGLELAQEMLEDAEVTNDISESEADAFGADDSAVYHRAARKELAKVGQAISAEISRLKGRGS